MEEVYFVMEKDIQIGDKIIVTVNGQPHELPVTAVNESAISSGNYQIVPIKGIWQVSGYQAPHSVHLVSSVKVKRPDFKLEDLSGILTQDQITSIRDYLKSRGLVVTARPTYCSCEHFEPGTAPGYKGEMDPVCLNCVQKCRRCKKPSTDCGYSGSCGENVCYGCAVGDNSSDEED
jgi:hypothetical protein